MQLRMLKISTMRPPKMQAAIGACHAWLLKDIKFMELRLVISFWLVANERTMWTRLSTMLRVQKIQSPVRLHSPVGFFKALRLMLAIVQY